MDERAGGPNIEQRFGPTSGVFLGWVGELVCAGVAVSGIASTSGVDGARVCLGAAVAGVLIWTVLLRPRVNVGREVLELRNPLSSWLIPLGLVETVQVRAFTRVGAAGRQYDGVAIGRRMRAGSRGSGRGLLSGYGLATRTPGSPDPVPDLVIGKILSEADRHRREHPHALSVAVRRTWARVELVALAGLSVAFGLTWIL